MSYAAEKTLECYNQGCEILESIATSDREAKRLRSQLFRAMFSLVARVLANDGTLSPGEADLLRQIFDWSEGSGEDFEFTEHYLAEWKSVSQEFPEFLEVAARSDALHTTDNANRLIEIIGQAGIYASIADDGDFSSDRQDSEDEEISVITDYKMFLSECVESALNDGQFSETQSSTPVPESDERQTPPEKAQNLEELVAALQKLIGLDAVKRDVSGLINLIKVRKLREEKGMQVPPLSLHLVFSGNPGTGKTTVARLLSNIYRAMGLLSVGHLVEVDRSGLVAGYVGQTALKVREVVTRALGGVLFVDEAYALNDKSSEHSFGREAIDALLKMMEDHRKNLVVIVAGYTEPMQQFLTSNPGLRSRFNKFIHFEDYSPQELYDIFVRFCADSGYTFDEDCGRLAASILQAQFEVRDANFGNARMVRNFFEHTISSHANRVAHMEDPCDDDLRTLLPVDLPAGGSFRT